VRVSAKLHHRYCHVHDISPRGVWSDFSIRLKAYNTTSRRRCIYGDGYFRINYYSGTLNRIQKIESYFVFLASSIATKLAERQFIFLQQKHKAQVSCSSKCYRVSKVPSVTRDHSAVAANLALYVADKDSYFQVNRFSTGNRSAFLRLLRRISVI